MLLFIPFPRNRFVTKVAAKRSSRGVIKNSGEESFTDSMNQRDNKSDDELLVGGAKKRRRRRRREKEGSGLGQGGSQFPSTPRRHEKWTESGGEFSRLIISLFCRVVASRRREKWRDRGMRFFVPPSLSRRQSNNSFRPLPHAKSRARSGIIVFLEIPSLWMDSTVSEFYFINPTSVRSIGFFFIITKEERIDEHLPGLLFNERRKRCKTRRGWSGFFMEMTEKME